MSFFISSRIKQLARGLALGLSVGVCGSLAMAQGALSLLLFVACGLHVRSRFKAIQAAAPKEST